MLPSSGQMTILSAAAKEINMFPILEGWKQNNNPFQFLAFVSGIVLQMMPVLPV